MFRYFIPLIALCIVPPAFAAQWQVLPKQSNISFKATQNHAPVEGKFTRFSANISFDPDHLETSSVKAIVDTGSVTTDYQEVADNLKQKDWLAVDAFPKATFESKNFKHLKGNQYEALGTLTIRNHKEPAKLLFTLIIKDNIASMVGTATLLRTKFGVGQGEWKSTKVVEDAVKVKVVLKARKVE
jgi:polyisoprenoid-binding protein YceI